MSKKSIFLNTILWGFLLWLFGYALGFLFFAFVPKDTIGWFIMPFGIAVTLWVLVKKIKRESFGCYIGLGMFWLIIAVVCDYFFLVKFLKAVDYYKLDVYLYYFLTFALPVLFGWFKFHQQKKIAD